MAGLFSSQAAVLLLLLCYVGTSMGVLFSSLEKTLIVTASPKPGQKLYAGVDKMTVAWSLNQSLPAGMASAYKTIKVSLCYGPVSQIDRGWRKTTDDLKKDKTCQFTVNSGPFTPNGTADYVVQRNVPTATYFVRAYALGADGVQLAYGQTTDAKKTTDLFEVVGISGRHASIEIAAGVFSAFSIAALVFFFVVEKKKSS